ncbi:HAD family hydrolase [bacterium]|nr:HAD family hydrolase [bacterium]
MHKQDARTLYVSDLDGTLLRNDAVLSPFTRDTLADLLAAGLPFTVASARSVVSMRPMLRGLPLRLPVVEINGAFLSDLETGRHESIASLAPDVAGELLAMIREAGCEPFLTTFDGREDRLYYREIRNAGMQWFLDDRKRAGDHRLRPIDDPVRALDDEIVCITTIADYEVLEELAAGYAARFGDRVQIHLFDSRYCKGWHWLTVHDVHATKDRAIRTLMESNGLAEHDLVVFGDEMNDVGMFRDADRAIAVANAVDGLKPYATHVIGSNEEDAVVTYLREVAERRRDETPGA